MWMMHRQSSQKFPKVLKSSQLPTRLSPNSLTIQVMTARSIFCRFPKPSQNPMGNFNHPIGNLKNHLKKKKEFFDFPGISRRSSRRAPAPPGASSAPWQDMTNSAVQWWTNSTMLFTFLGTTRVTRVTHCSQLSLLLVEPSRPGKLSCWWEDRMTKAAMLKAWGKEKRIFGSSTFDYPLVTSEESCWSKAVPRIVVVLGEDFPQPLSLQQLENST